MRHETPALDPLKEGIARDTYNHSAPLCTGGATVW
jgi:hypothetical protein